MFFPSEIAAAKAASAANRKRDTVELAAGLRDTPLAGNVDVEIEQCQDRGQANVRLTLRVPDSFEMPGDPSYAATLERLLPEVQKKCSHTTRPVRTLFVRNFVSDIEVNNVLADATDVPILTSVHAGHLELKYFNGGGFPIASVDLPPTRPR